MAAAWSSISFTVPKQDRPAIPYPDASEGAFAAFHVPGSDEDLIQYAGSGHEVLEETIRLASLSVYVALAALRFETHDITGWPIEGGGSDTLAGMQLMRLSKPVRWVTHGGGFIYTTALWWRQSINS